MTNHKSVWTFYVLSFIAVLSCGIHFGFSDAHTIPIPFMMELVVLPVGVVWLLMGLIILSTRHFPVKKYLLGHVFGLLMNLTLLLCSAVQ